MGKYRRAARVDANQEEIVKLLEGTFCCSVQAGHDDILVGYKGKTSWYEIKNPEHAANKEGKVYESCKKFIQKKLQEEWKGHYKIVTTIEEILTDIGIMT